MKVQSAGRATFGGVAVAALVAAVAGCSSTASGPRAGSGATTATGAATSGAAAGSVTVFAAASLKDAFTRIGKQFETANPGAKVAFNFGGSATLATQITTGGAPADVFAAASAATMKTVTDAGDASGTPSAFAHNQLEIAVAPGNPKGVAVLADLTRPGLKVVLCAVAQPCGAAASAVVRGANLPLTPVSLEADVSAALTKVELGEADAALVYKTDVRSAAGKVTGVDFPESSTAINTYPIAALAHAPNSTAASAFVAYVLSAEGQAVLAEDGFAKP